MRHIRSIPDDVAEHIRRAAGAREMTQAEYISALVRLHDAMRARADAGDDGIQTELAALGLETVEV